MLTVDVKRLNNDIRQILLYHCGEIFNALFTTTNFNLKALILPTLNTYTTTLLPHQDSYQEFLYHSERLENLYHLAAAHGILYTDNADHPLESHSIENALQWFCYIPIPLHNKPLCRLLLAHKTTIEITLLEYTQHSARYMPHNALQLLENLHPLWNSEGPLYAKTLRKIYEAMILRLREQITDRPTRALIWEKLHAAILKDEQAKKYRQMRQDVKNRIGYLK
jgi:hypothetical protein